MIPHRVRQFLEAGRLPTRDDFELAAGLLDEPLLRLFEAQHPRDVVHSANTARWLLDRGHRDPDLLAAALLHDIGKGAQRRVDRALYVVAENVRLARVLAAPGSRFELRRAAARTLTHGEAGAAALAAAGASARVIAFTRLHHEPPRGDGVLALLQQADAAN